MPITLNGTTGITTPGIDSSGNPVLSGGTANGVAYANASKVLTTGTSLVFDGTNLTVGASSQIGSAVLGVAVNTATANGFSYKTTTDGAFGALRALNNAGTEKLNIQYDTTNAFMAFRTDNVERARLDSAGNLGLGVTPTSWGQSGTLQAIQIKQAAIAASGSNTYWGSNWYGGGFDKYIAGGTVSASLLVQTGGQFVFYTAGAPAAHSAGDAISFTQAMTLDASSNLLLGISSSSGYRMQVAGDNPTRGILQHIYNFGGAPRSGAQLLFAQAGVDNWVIGQPAGTSAFAIWSGRDGSNDGTERARINSSGHFMVAKTTGDDTSNVGFIAYADGTVTTTLNFAGGTNTYHVYNKNATNNGYRFYVSTNGGIYNYSGNNVNLSDERVKTDIEDAGGYLAKICAIPVRTFRYKDQGDDLEKTLGVIAQEVEAVAPELVNNDGFGETPEDGVPLKTVYQTDLQYALMKCIQEQQALITSLTARMNAQDTEIAALKGAA